MLFRKDRAVVLFKRPFKDSHEWVTLFTQERGKLTAMAYGTKSLTSRYRGTLEPLTLVEVSFAETDHYITIKEAKKIRGFGGIGMDLSPTYFAFSLLELLHTFVPEQVEEPELFALLLEVLACIEGGVKPHLSTMYFAVQVYTRLGLFPAFAHCGECSTKLTEQQGYLSLQDTSFHCQSCVSGTLHMTLPFRYVKVLHFLQSRSLAEALLLRLEDGDKEFLSRFLEQVYRELADREASSAQLKDSGIIHTD